MANREELKNKCLECKHSGLCKYQEKYNEIFKTIKIYEQPFEMVLNCYLFLDKDNKTVPYTINLTQFPLSYRNQCEGCSIYEDIKKVIYSVNDTCVNDACSFCSKSPLKIATAK